MCRLWIALYAVSIQLARAGLAREARVRAVREGAAPFPLRRASEGCAAAATAAAAAAAARYAPLPLPHPLSAEDSGDGSAWERLSQHQRADAIKAVVRRHNDPRHCPVSVCARPGRLLHVGTLCGCIFGSQRAPRLRNGILQTG